MFHDLKSALSKVKDIHQDRGNNQSQAKLWIKADVIIAGTPSSRSLYVSGVWLSCAITPSLPILKLSQLVATTDGVMALTLFPGHNPSISPLGMFLVCFYFHLISNPLLVLIFISSTKPI